MSSRTSAVAHLEHTEPQADSRAPLIYCPRPNFFVEERALSREKRRDASRFERRDNGPKRGRLFSEKRFRRPSSFEGAQNDDYSAADDATVLVPMERDESRKTPPRHPR